MTFYFKHQIVFSIMLAASSSWIRDKNASADKVSLKAE
jgi:hypothetical protein